MKSNRHPDTRGFTLVELMIVVAIIGVLAALAIYGVRRYLASAKTSEAKNTVGAISRSATAAYTREWEGAESISEGSSSSQVSHALCGSATAVPANIKAVFGTKYQPNSATDQDYEATSTTNGWKCLGFASTQPQYYQYHYNLGGAVAPDNPAGCKSGGGGPGMGPSPGMPGGASAGCYEAAAMGNVDGDPTYSYFARTGKINFATGTLTASTVVHIKNQYE